MNSPFNEQLYKGLLEGLEISEVKYSTVINGNDWHRYDAEYFKKEATKIVSKIQGHQYELIGECYDVSKLAGFEFTKFFTPENMESKDNYIALTSKNIQREKLDLRDFITIDKKVADGYLTRSKIEFEDIILSYTGEYRRSLVMQDKVHYQLGPNICRIRKKNDKISPYYLSVFLNSYIGQTILDREKTLSAQPTVAMSRIRQIPVPIINNQSIFRELLNSAYAKGKKAKQLYSEAEEMLYTKLGLDVWHHSKKSTNIKKFKDSFLNSGRLDAEYYQVKYEELEELIKKVPYVTLAEIHQLNVRGVQPDYVDDGCVSVINSKHILEDGLDYDNFERTTETFWSTNERAQIEFNDILIYTTGANIGRAQVYLKHNHALASNHVNILRVEEVNPIYLALLLNTPIGRMQTEKICTGSAQVEIYPNDIDKFIIPVLDKDTQEAIAANVLNSFKLKEEIQQLLKTANETVEFEFKKEVNSNSEK